jgi:hypothetical protein
MQAVTYPYAVRRRVLRYEERTFVINVRSGKVFAHCLTPEEAPRQLRRAAARYPERKFRVVSMRIPVWS